MPPGTGDAQLSLVQSTQVDGAIIVTTPQVAAVGDALRGAVPLYAPRRTPTKAPDHRGRTDTPAAITLRAIAGAFVKQAAAPSSFPSSAASRDFSSTSILQRRDARKPLPIITSLA